MRRLAECGEEREGSLFSWAAAVWQESGGERLERGDLQANRKHKKINSNFIYLFCCY